MIKPFFCATDKTPLMNLLLFILTFLAPFNPDISARIDFDASDELVMKSKLNKEGDKLLVRLELPKEDVIWFELYNRDGDIKHLWEEQLLTSGTHDIALPLPSVGAGSYAIKLMGEHHEVTQLLFIQ